MTFEVLRALLDEPATHAAIVGTHRDRYHLGITRVSTGELGYYLRAPAREDGTRIVHLSSGDVTVVVDGDPAETMPADGQAWMASARRGKRAVSFGIAALLRGWFVNLSECQEQRPLVCGLQIQNWNEDQRQNSIIRGQPTHGTLGGFATLDADVVLLSASHVLAGLNSGKADDLIVQPGQSTSAAAGSHEVARLTSFVSRTLSPFDARPSMGNVYYNEVDAAMATLSSGIRGDQTYLAEHGITVSISRTNTVSLDDSVLKVGAATGVTRGTVKAVNAITSVPENGGVFWYKNSFLIKGDGPGSFVERGDSGALVINAGTGDALGLLYAMDGNGEIGLACPIDAVCAALKCALLA